MPDDLTLEMSEAKMKPALLTIVVAVIVTAASFCADVEMNGGKCVQVDGKPFFAIGMYSVGRSDFEILADAGFNLVHTYGWEGRSEHKWGKQWLDAAEQNNLKALVGLYRPRVRNMEFDECIQRIRTYRDHPALLAWHTMDEPDLDNEDDPGDKYMPRAYKLIKQHDPHHPVTAVVCHFADTDAFEQTVDILQADYYPVPPIPANWYSGTGFRGIKIFVDRWRNATGGDKPFWFVCQAFDYSLLKQDSHDIPPKWQRFPTLRELRTMTYTAIASGARGILYWSLSRLQNTRQDSEVTADDHWNRLKSVVAELQKLKPLIEADTNETIIDQDHVVAMVKSDGTHTYVITANYERKPTETVLHIPGVDNTTAEIVFDDGHRKVTDGKLPVSLKAIESRVYRFQ